jgi:copper chaperone CopZ
VTQAIRSVKGVLQVDVSYFKKAAFVKAQGTLCRRKGVFAIKKAVKALQGSYKAELYEMKQASTADPASHLLRRKIVPKTKKGQISPASRPVESLQKL